MDIAIALPASLFEAVDALPWISVSCGGVHPFITHNHAPLTSTNDEEVLRRPLGPCLLPESLVSLLDLFVLSRREAVAVLLSHHGDRPVTLVEAIDRSSLAVAQQPVQLGLHSARELLNAGIEVGLVGLGATTEKARGERTLVGGLIRMKGVPRHGGEVILRIWFCDAGDIGVGLSVASADRETTKGRFLNGILRVGVINDPGLEDGLGDTLLFWNAAAHGQ